MTTARVDPLLTAALVVLTVLVAAPTAFSTWMLLSGLTHAGDDPSGYTVPFAVIFLITLSPSVACVGLAWLVRRRNRVASAVLVLVAAAMLIGIGTLIAGGAGLVALVPVVVGLAGGGLALASLIRVHHR